MKALQNGRSKLKNRVSRLQDENKNLRAELALEKARSSIMVAGRLKKSAKRTGRVTPTGGYTMALMRNSAHVGTLGLVKMLQLPVSRQTVERWERLLATNLLIQSRLFYKHVYDTAMIQHDGCGAEAFSWELHNVRADATNSSVGLHSLKAFVCVIDSRCRDIHGSCVQHSVYPDLQQQPVHCYGHTVRSMLLKQLQSAGLSAWSDQWPQSAHGLHIKWYLFSSDQGGDQTSSHSLIQADVEDIELTWYSRVWCLDHVDHLIAGVNLQRFFSYWCSLATFVNVCRAPGNGFRIKLAWHEMFGADSGVTAMKKLPPRRTFFL